MINVFCAEWKRAMNIWCLLGILGVAFSICFDSWNDLMQSLKSNQGYVHYFFWNSAFGGMCRTYLLPIFATFPFATSFSHERRNKSVAFIVSREGKKKYCLVKYLVNAISGGVVVAIGTALVLFVLSTMFPMTNAEFQDVQVSDMFHSWLAVYKPMEYCMLEICLGFFRGMIWSSIALLISVLIEDPFVVIVSPYVVSYAFVQFCRLLQINNQYRLDMILIGRTVINSSWNTVAIALAVTLMLDVIIGVIFIKYIVRGLKDGTII